MTKGELVKLLDKYDDNMKIKFTLECDNDFRDIDKVRMSEAKEFIILESKEIPNGDDLYFMIKALLNSPNSLTIKEEKTLREFIEI